MAVSRGFADFVCTRHIGVPFSAHCVSNMLIEFVGLDAAVVETYVTCFQTYPPRTAASLAQFASDKAASEIKDPAHLFLSGRYVDKVTRRGGGWRFQTRQVVYDASMLLNTTSTPLDQKLGHWKA